MHHPDLCLRYICKYFITRSPQLVATAGLHRGLCNTSCHQRTPPARPIYTSSDGAHETEVWSSCGSAVDLVIIASSSLSQSLWRGYLYHHRILSSSQFVDSFSLASLLVSSQYPSHVTPRITGMPFGCGASASVPNSGSIQALPGYKIALACVTKYMEQRSAAVKRESLLYCGR
jgi:hypothetical protein